MKKYFPDRFIRMLRNDVPIESVITQFLNMEWRNKMNLLRFRCPLCGNFHTAINPKANLARCFDCRRNFNPIDMVIAVTKCSFLEAVSLLEDNISS